jgi:hypothetical protein
MGPKQRGGTDLGIAPYRIVVFALDVRREDYRSRL